MSKRHCLVFPLLYMIYIQLFVRQITHTHEWEITQWTTIRKVTTGPHHQFHEYEVDSFFS
jgi:hypothetical protein